MNRITYFFILLCTLLITIDLQAIPKKYKYQLAAVTVFQDEAPWLKEWIEYHKLIGFEHFYMCNNLSNDNYIEVLEPYIQSGEVELFQYYHNSPNLDEHIKYTQLPAFMDAVYRARGVVKWLAIIDADEFIVPLKTNLLMNILKDFDDVGGVYINWLNFGTSHIEKIPKDKLMIETLVYCCEQPLNVGKTIVRPERVSFFFSPHTAAYHAPFGHVNTNREMSPDGRGDPHHFPVADDKLLIYHYYTRDIDHLINVKIPRRSKWMVNLNPKNYIAGLEYLNMTYNPNMERFIPQLKANMIK